MHTTKNFYKKTAATLLIVIICFALIPSTQSQQQFTTSFQEEGTLSGYVINPVGNTIAGALVRVYFHGTYRENYSDPTGYYHVTDIPICYCLKNCTASHPDYYPEWILMGIVENSTHTFILIPKNSSGIPPPYGPVEGYIKEPLTFYFDIPQNPNYDSVYLQWYWDDGTASDWYGPYAGGETASATHTWMEPGFYQILVKIKDIYGVITISDPFNIIIHGGADLAIPPGYIKGGISKVTAQIHNIGETNAENIHWSITVQGGISSKIMIKTDGTVLTLAKNNKETIATDQPIIGFGVVGITITAQADHSEPVIVQIFGIAIFIYIYTPPLLNR